MNKIRKISVAMLAWGIIFLALATVVLPSCSNSCKNLACQNTSGCNAGSCSCPSGYSGRLCELSSIVFVNQSPTEVYLNINGVTSEIQPTYSVTITDTSGKSVTAEAYTYTGPMGSARGDTVKWTEPYTYPAMTATLAGTVQTVPLAVGNSYVLLKIVNNDASQTVDSIVVSNAGSITTAGQLAIPNNDTAYNLGYYPATSSTTVTAYGSNGGVWAFSTTYLGILFTSNQTSTITIP